MSRSALGDVFLCSVFVVDWSCCDVVVSVFVRFST